MEINERVLRATDPEVRGLVRLELTDRHTGRVLERVEAENDISQWWQLLSRRYARSLFFGGNPNQTAADKAIQIGLNHVYLSDSGESLGEPLLDGQMVGWADKGTYVGASTKRGTIIAAECLSDPTFTRYVWEWPTTAANGVVRSVGMCDDASSEVRMALTAIRYRNETQLPPVLERRTAAAYFDPAAAALWTVESNVVQKFPMTPAVYENVGINDYVPSTATASVPRANIAWPSNTLSDVTGDGTNLYVAASTSAIKKFAYPTSLSADPTESTISVSGRTAMVCVAHDGSYLWVSEGTTVYRVDATSGAIERSFAIAFAPSGMQWYPERNMLIITSNGAMYGYDLDGNLKFTINPPVMAFSWSSGVQAYYLSDHFVMAWGLVAVSGYHRAHEVLGSFRPGSRTVLGAEVEKTNLTGMKLTYTFTFS